MMRLAKAAWSAWHEVMFAPFAGCLRLAGPVLVRVLPDVPDHCGQCRAEREAGR